MAKEIKNIKIERIGYGGVGIAQNTDGKKIIIKGGALPGSTVNIKITRKKSDYLEGHITKIHKYDKKYTDGEIFCPHFFSSTTKFLKSNDEKNLDQKTDSDNMKITEGNKDGLNIIEVKRSIELPKHKIGCGGCKRQLISYPKQLELKQDIIEDCFRKIKDKPKILPIVPSPKEKGYRNKIEFSFGVYISQKDEVHNKRNLGFHKQGEFSKIVDIDSCGLISTKMNEVFEYIKNLCFNSGLPTYDQKFHRGFFRHLVIREGTNTGEILVNLAIFPIDDKDKENFEKRKKLKEIFKNDKFIKQSTTTFILTYNDGLADIIRGPNIQTEILFGNGHIFDKLISTPLTKGASRDLISESTQPPSSPSQRDTIESTFRISPFSFFQTNTHGAEKLFQTGADAINKTKGKILDLYCGAGSIGIHFLNMGIGEKLLGIDIVQEAINDANYNSKLNGLENKCKFIASPSEKIFKNNPEINNELKNIGLAIVDPPREGLHKNVIDRIEDLKKENNFEILYISCNPTTMARDIEIFMNKGFKIKSLQAVDMFPQTHHIETVGVLI